MDSATTQTGLVLVSGQPFDETLEFFTKQLGFQLDLITPADDPAIAEVSAAGIRLRIDRSVEPTPLTLQLSINTGSVNTGSDNTPRTVHAPNGVVVEFAPASSLQVPDLAPELVISVADDASNWVIGRAGMRYRDLIPSRLGGRYIASHIEVCDGGPVPDLVHHHDIRFQMIFCHRGWVDVVYEDQGDAFRLEAGDCVLQPPHIRHKVLESSAGAQVVEIGCPAEHDTLFDHSLVLPTNVIDADRDFGGQRFVRHQAANAPWAPSPHPGFEEQHTDIEQATNGLASVRVVRAGDQTATVATSHDADFWFMFVLDGSAKFHIDGSAPLVLGVGDSAAIPAATSWHLDNASADLTLLEVVVN